MATKAAPTSAQMQAYQKLGPLKAKIAAIEKEMAEIAKDLRGTTLAPAVATLVRTRRGKAKSPAKTKAAGAKKTAGGGVKKPRKKKAATA